MSIVLMMLCHVPHVMGFENHVKSWKFLDFVFQSVKMEFLSFSLSLFFCGGTVERPC